MYLKRNDLMYQVVEMTQQEQVEMYNLIDKQKLIEMLIQANKVIRQLSEENLNGIRGF